MLNFSATFNVVRLLYNPKLCIPHLTVPTFNELPVPVGPGIRAVVLDKDNCFAYPDSNEVYGEYSSKFAELRSRYPGAALVIVSNSAGSSDDKGYRQAEVVEANTGVSVLKHFTKKPGCHNEILQYFKQNQIVEKPDQIAIVGDRLFTDILMANMMGSYGVWIRDGVKVSKNPISLLEKRLYEFMKN